MTVALFDIRGNVNVIRMITITPVYRASKTSMNSTAIWNMIMGIIKMPGLSSEHMVTKDSVFKSDWTDIYDVSLSLVWSTATQMDWDQVIDSTSQGYSISSHWKVLWFSWIWAQNAPICLGIHHVKRMGWWLWVMSCLFCFFFSTLFSFHNFHRGWLLFHHVIQLYLFLPGHLQRSCKCEQVWKEVWSDPLSLFFSSHITGSVALHVDN